MAAYSARAVVLRKTKLGEADTIVTMLGSDGRQIRAVAKGVRRTKSKIGARLEPYALVDLLLHSGRSLDVVREVETVASHDAIRADFDRTAAAAVVADLLDKATMDADAEPVLYELALASLAAIQEAAPQGLPWLVGAFLLKTMSLLGFRPTLASCAACESEDRLVSTFSVTHGGLLCGDCAGIDEGATRMSPAASEAVVRLMRGTMQEIALFGEPVAARDEVLRLLGRFASHHVHARLRSLEFLETQMAQGMWPSVDPSTTVG